MNKGRLTRTDNRQRWFVRRKLQSKPGGSTPLETAKGLAQHSLELAATAQVKAHRWTFTSILVAGVAAAVAPLELLPDHTVPMSLLIAIRWTIASSALVSVTGAGFAATNAIRSGVLKSRYEDDQRDVEAITKQLRLAQAHDESADSPCRHYLPSTSTPRSTVSNCDTDGAELFPEPEGSADSGSQLRQLLHTVVRACEDNELLPNEAEWREQTAWLRHMWHSAEGRVDLRDVSQQSLADMARTAQILLAQARVESVDEIREAWEVFTRQNRQALLQHVTHKLNARRQPSQVAQKQDLP